MTSYSKSVANTLDQLIPIYRSKSNHMLDLITSGQQHQNKQTDTDANGNPLMTLKTVKHLCEKESLFATPELNEKLYLHFRGFLRIIPQTLGLYINIVTLWLNNNAIVRIEGLSNCLRLVSLYLNNNFIDQIEGLEALKELTVLNLSHNKIQSIRNLQDLPRLQSLNISSNFIVSQDGLGGLADCVSLQTLDLSRNELANSRKVLDALSKNRSLFCLLLKQTPFARGFINYRKTCISTFPQLKFLDDRPVFEADHRLAIAWLRGGIQEERIQKLKMLEEKGKTDLELSQMPFKGRTVSKAEGFIASITDISLRIMNMPSVQQEQRVIDTYFQSQKQIIQQNLQKLRTLQALQKEQRQHYLQIEDQQIVRKVHEQFRTNELLLEEEQTKARQHTRRKWQSKYNQLLEALLQKYLFDFSEVQPSLNMILNSINKKIGKSHVRFQINQLRIIWTDLEIARRQTEIP